MRDFSDFFCAVSAVIYAEKHNLFIIIADERSSSFQTLTECA